MSLPVPLALVVAGAALALATDVPALPALRCPPDATAFQCSEHNDRKFKVEGLYLRFEYDGDNALRLQCSNSLQLDSVRAYLPRFTSALNVGNVTVVDCPPAHYATVLAALNVTLTLPFNLELFNTRQNEPLTAALFTDLPPLSHLALRHAGLLHGLPASLEGLTTLTMEYTSLLDDTVLETLPCTLTELRLEGVNITRVPAAVLDLPELRSLHVSSTYSTGTVESSNTSRLQQLYVYGADAALMSDWAPPALEEVTLEYWRAKNPNPIPACDNLVKLTLLHPHVSELPVGWVARCPRLKNLHIMAARYVLELPARLLENATQLTSLDIIGDTIMTPKLTLPPQLFAGTPHLTHLKLSYNLLTELPAQLFANTPHLTHLDLNYNQLIQLPSSMLTLPLLSLNLGGNWFDASVFTELAAFTELRSLSLAGNWGIGDLCAVNDSNVAGKSLLASLSKLERLELYETGISVICSDWREDMVNLEYLDLSHTKIRNLTYEEMRYNRNVPAVVVLPGTIYFTADDYDRAAAAAPLAASNRNVTVMLITKTFDGCSLYWVTKAIDDDLLSLYDVQLYDNELYKRRSLRTVRAEDLLCPSREMCAAVPSSCNCGMAGDGLLRIVCVDVKLDHVPQLPSINNDTNVHAVDLVLVNSSFTELVLNDIPPHLRVLDLRNNSISYMTETTARALVSGTKRRVLLAGNRLECLGQTTPVLRVLRDHFGNDSMRCSCSKFSVSLATIIAASLLALW